MKNLDVQVKGPGPGRESAVRALNACGFKISNITDVTPIPHNGCRPPKEAPSYKRRTNMARYIGPKCKLSRREGTDLFLKSGVRLTRLQVQGRKRLPVSTVRVVAACPTTVYSCARSRKYVVSTACWRSSSATTTRKRIARRVRPVKTCCSCWNRRLDNVVYRMGFGSTRAEARQLVSHKSILVNGQSVNIPSYQVEARVTWFPCVRRPKQLRIQGALALAAQRGAG